MEPWRIITPRLTAGSISRSAELLRLVALQFDVEHASRYAPSEKSTFCNIYVWDVTKALGCEIPHYWHAHEMNANGICEWLASTGGEHGWRKLSGSDEAKQNAALGLPVVASWHNPGGTGHVAMVLPSREDGAVRIAQAGRTCLWDRPIAEGFGERVSEVSYWSHN